MPDSLRHRIEHALARGTFRAFAALPERAAAGLGAGLASVAHSPFRIRLNIVEEQIAAAFPDRGMAWVRETARASYRHFGREAAEIVRLNAGGRRDLLDRISGLEEARRTFASEGAPGLGAVIVTGHLGNWEAAGAVVSSLGMPLAAVVKRQSNPGFDRLLLESRRALGIEPIYMEDARSAMPDLIRSGTSVALVADQDARSRGIFVPFLGRPASTFRGPARLSQATGAPLFFGAAIRDGDGYRSVVEPVVTELSGPDAEVDLTEKWVARLEAWVRRHPEQYFWFHRRWKTVPEDAGPGPGTGEPPSR